MIMAENPLCEKCVMSNSFDQPETNEWITLGVAQTSPVSSVIKHTQKAVARENKSQESIIYYFYMFIYDQTEFNHLLLTGKTIFRFKLLTCFIS